MKGALLVLTVTFTVAMGVSYVPTLVLEYAPVQGNLPIHGVPLTDPSPSAPTDTCTTNCFFAGDGGSMGGGSAIMKN